ncbi:MerR family transcriptional regulator [Amorphus orientalis]|uniref:DNA-binding transcriptional MerR regulator n=1 Tax=Amorphus orientalis TaxID=649198 RepID=A0AAE3VLS0_9HYPH|nr:MerR family DNA-binding transcriptional regulator [Amorphus orientalis]MDQ0314330.1 DNA-binding transcriptional MerR regulator [Amorphus orientalis]
MTGNFYTITQLAEELGVTPRAVRFYEDKGLLSPGRAGATRIYTVRDRARLILILRGKRLGFTLQEIKEYLDLYDLDRTQKEQLQRLLTGVRERKQRLEEQREALDTTLSELHAIELQASEALAQFERSKAS